MFLEVNLCAGKGVLVKMVKKNRMYSRKLKKVHDFALDNLIGIFKNKYREKI